MKKGWVMPNLFVLYISVLTLFVIQSASAVCAVDCGCRWDRTMPVTISGYFLPLV